MMAYALDPREYTLSQTGVIQNPGRFEGCMLWVPYFWDVSLDGVGDEQDGGVVSIPVTKEDKDYFDSLWREPGVPNADTLRAVAKMLRRRQRIRLYQREDGFVCEA